MASPLMARPKNVQVDRHIIPAKKAMNDMGADILRLWVASAITAMRSLPVMKSLSEPPIPTDVSAIRQILMANLAGFEPTQMPCR